MENEIAKILEIIVFKASYNKETGCYQLSKEDYTHLNLSRNTRKTINQVCENLGINLEYPNKPLPNIKDEELFPEYNEIKSKLLTITNPKDKEQLEQRRIELRNKIVTSNLGLINSIINRRLIGIHDRIDKDDIYQTGYEILISYVDKNYLDKNTFKNSIALPLMVHIERKIMIYNDNISQYKKDQASILTQAKNEYQTIISKELSEKLGISQEKIEILSNLENLLSTLSLDELIESINIEEINDDSPLYDDTFEERLIDQYSTQEVLSIIISTLPEVNKKVLTLYYGLNGNIPHTMKEIGKIYGVTRVRIRSIITESLNIIRNSLRIKYLKEISKISDSYEEEQDDTLNLELEEFLIRYLPNNMLDEFSKELSETHKKFLSIYCHQNNYQMKEIIKLLDISKSHAYKIKRETLKVIRNNIMSSITNNKYITYDEYSKYIEYLFHIYSHKTRTRKRG